MIAHNCGPGAGGRGFKNGCGRVAPSRGGGGRSLPPRTTMRGSSSAVMVWSTTLALPIGNNGCSGCGSSATVILDPGYDEICNPISFCGNELNQLFHWTSSYFLYPPPFL
jgi:hypothetical protein